MASEETAIKIILTEDSEASEETAMTLTSINC